MRILALDLGTKCGFAHSAGPSGLWDLSVKRDESSGMRLVRLIGKLNEIRREVGIDLVVYEAARHAAPHMQGALVVLAEMQGQVKSWCTQREIDYRGYSPTEIKKHATGKGNSNKEKMIEAAEKKWPDVKILSSDHADALWILDLIKSELGEG